MAKNPADGTYEAEIDPRFPITGREHVYGSDTFDEDVPFNDTRDQRLDAGLTFGAGVGTNVLGLLGGEALQRLTLEFEIRWYYGMLDIQKDYMRNLNPRYNTTLAFQGGISYTL